MKAWAFAICALLAQIALPPAVTYGASAGAPKASRSPGSDGPPRAPSRPPLIAPHTGATVQADGEEGALAGSDASASAPPSGGDPLVENGLGSPLCGTPGALSATSRRNCATSGFEAAGAPTGDYALDVHIDTGLLGLTTQTVLQDYVIEPAWMGLVWVVHALVVALEWCFTLDLLDSAAMSGLERTLRATQSSFTGPWTALALALASLTAAYNGLVRRQVTETLGQAALMLAMMAGGLWVIADPAGTVGALGRWVDEASVGTLGAVVQGTPAHAPRTLAQSMGGLFAGVVGAPWCYLEFGNVSWCEDPARLEPRLRAAGLAIVAGAPSASARLMRAARTNGELFLALPANQAARNSINDTSSLLSVLCGGSESATECRGPTAAQAQFRTQGGTMPRLTGLLLIAIGALGMILLLGFIALHLLGAEILSLLYLLLAPAAVIAPALGEGGRAAFRTWGTRLLGAVCSKLIFSFLLGVVLLMTRTLMGLDALGWWTRWLLVTVLWWGAYGRRHQALGFIAGDRSKPGRRGDGEHHRSLLPGVRQLEGRAGLTVPRRTVQWARGRLASPAPDVERRRPVARSDSPSARPTADEQVTRMLEREHAEATTRAAGAPEVEVELSRKRARLQRIRGAQREAKAADDTRRAVGLGARARRVEHEIEHEQRTLDAARRIVADGARTRRITGSAYTPEQARERSRLLDAQAKLPVSPGRGVGVGGEAATGRRDYAALASLVGYGREQYERLDPRGRREARLEVDRELALRRELRASPVAGGPAGVAARDTGRVLRERRPHEAPRHDSPRGHAAAGSRESAVMRDAREVAEGRKRQLGG